MNATKTQIVIAWPDETMELVDPGAPDIGRSAKFTARPIGKAAMWLRRGTPADLEKARAYCATEPGRRAYSYPISERDPLGRARREVIE